MTTSSNPRFGLLCTESRILHSECVGEEYRIGIWTPYSYLGSEKSYPVLYIPDGDFAFSIAHGLLPPMLNLQEIPEMIVVGIGYNLISSYWELGQVRDRDLVTAQFLKDPSKTRNRQYADFFERELIPTIETHYRVDPANRALYGFSSSGFFAMQMFFTRPGLFRRTIAASCTWPGADRVMLDYEEQYARQPSHPPADLFLAVGGLEDDQLPGFHALAGALRQRDYPDLKLATRIVEGERHGAGVITQAMLHGLRAVFQ